MIRGSGTDPASNSTAGHHSEYSLAIIFTKTLTIIVWIVPSLVVWIMTTAPIYSLQARAFLRDRFSALARTLLTVRPLTFTLSSKGSEVFLKGYGCKVASA